MSDDEARDNEPQCDSRYVVRCTRRAGHDGDHEHYGSLAWTDEDAD